MIRILKYGRYDDETIVTTCKNCKCVLEYHKRNIIERRMNPDVDIVPTVTCPQCGKPIIVI